MLRHAFASQVDEAMMFDGRLFHRVVELDDVREGFDRGMALSLDDGQGRFPAFAVGRCADGRFLLSVDGVELGIFDTLAEAMTAGMKSDMPALEVQ